MNKTKILIVVALITTSSALGEIYSIGGRKQIFIDRKFIEEDTGITLTMNPPVKQGLVVAGIHPWEDGIISGGGTVLESQGEYRMWYTSLPAKVMQINDSNWQLCYAQSSDGIHWIKPELGLFEWAGSKANNIVLENTHVENGGGIFIDPVASPDQRYKLVALFNSPPNVPVTAPEGWGMYIYTSPNGTKWTLYPKRLFPFVPDSVNMALYDDRTGGYLAYVRTWGDNKRRVGVVAMKDIMQPWPYDHSSAASRSKDFPWAEDPDPSRLVPPTRQVPDAFGVTSDDPPDIDHYTSAVVKYPWAEDAYFMFPSAYLHFPEPPGSRSNDGPLDIQLAVSRDGLKFERISRRPYIGLGPNGTRDSGSLYMYIGMIRRGNEIYQYYGGYTYTHAGDQGNDEKVSEGGVFLVRQRLDGFVSVDADYEGGRFMTPPLVFQGQHLQLNMDASGTGEVEVELRDADGKPITGYSFAESDSLYQNDVAKLVTWRGGKADVGSLAGKPVRVAFKLRSVKLYAFQFVD